MAIQSAGTRLNKYISETGLCSRREADRLIDDGLVTINGKVAGMGEQVAPGDHVKVRGKALREKPRPVYLAYNKPVGITCTTDPAVPENIVDAVKYRGGRIFPVGRLDKPSEGLILLTNDGDIVNKILRAGNAHEKEYIVTVDRPFGADFVQAMGSGIPILGTVTQPCEVRQTAPTTFNIKLTQGLNRQIRRMTEYLGYTVVKLRRVRIMNIRLDGLKPGQWRELTSQEMDLIDQMVASSSKTEDASLSAAKSARSKPVPKNAGDRKPQGKGRTPKAASAKPGASKPGKSKSGKPKSGPPKSGSSRGKPSGKPAHTGRPGPGSGKPGGKGRPAAKGGGGKPRAGRGR